MIDRLLFVLLCGLGVLLYVILLRQMNGLRERVETLMVRTERLGRAVKRITRRTPATRLGHMHRTDSESEPQWIIVDPGGRVLSAVPAEKIVNRMPGEVAGAADLADDIIVRQHSNDPDGAHSYNETFRQSYREDAEMAAWSVFPVCVLRETACGYDILLC